MTWSYKGSGLQLHACNIIELSRQVLPIVMCFSEIRGVLMYLCLLMFCIMLHCLHHVDFLRIVLSWISTNGRHWHMKKRSGDLHQLDADDEGTLCWNGYWRCIHVPRWTQRTNVMTPAALLWRGLKVSHFCVLHTVVKPHVLSYWKDMDLYMGQNNWTWDLGC